MNSKIKNYVDVLFSDIPRTRKAQELKQEMMSNLNERYEEYISQNIAENQAYTMAIGSFGDVDEMLKGLVPDREIKEKIDVYRKLRARNTAIAVGLYILGSVCIIAGGGIPAVFNIGNPSMGGIIGLILLLCMTAIATGILIYTKMSIPQDVEPFLRVSDDDTEHFDITTENGRFISSFLKLYWLVITTVYLGVSFLTSAWGITWLIWLIAAAVKQAIVLFFDVSTANRK